VHLHCILIKVWRGCVRNRSLWACNNGSPPSALSNLLTDVHLDNFLKWV
jgi:hypothetical protein